MKSALVLVGLLLCAGCATPRVASGRVIDQHGAGVADAGILLRTAVIIPGPSFANAPAVLGSPIPDPYHELDTGEVRTTTRPDGSWSVFLPWSTSPDIRVSPSSDTLDLPRHLWQQLGFSDAAARLWRVPADGPRALWCGRSGAKAHADGWWYPLHLLRPGRGMQADAAVRRAPDGSLELRMLRGGLRRTDEAYPVAAPADGYTTHLHFTQPDKALYYWRRPGATVRHGVVRLIVPHGLDSIQAESVLRQDAGRRLDHPPIGWYAGDSVSAMAVSDEAPED
jgi:hypothetical protein